MMNPNDIQVPVDPVFAQLVQKLMHFKQQEIPEDGTGITLKRHSEDAAREILIETLGMVERFGQSRSAIAKYDLLKWIGNKKNEVRFYR